MSQKSVLWLFLIAEIVFVNVQCQGNVDSYKRRQTSASKISGDSKITSKDDLEYPWLVGFHDRWHEKTFCAGSLISNRHVLSAAHCFQENRFYKFVETSPYHVLAMLGRFNVSDHDEAGSLNSLVWEIFIHPEWNLKSEHPDADISVVVLEDVIEFSEFIRPVRLPELSHKSEVVGGGTDNFSSKDHQETPSKIKILAVPFTKCATNATQSSPIHDMRIFCAGFIGKPIAACAGDNGGGFYVEDANGVNSIEGIVSNSNSATQDTPSVCQSDTYSTYTIVANFVPWIKEKVRETIKKVVEDAEYACDEESDGYTRCWTKSRLPSSVRVVLQNFQGDPKDVRELSLAFGSARVIEGISETFPNLEELKAKSSSISSKIERRTFANMTKLRALRLEDVELITPHFFDDLVKLEELECTRCRIPKQPNNLFNVLRNLKILILSGSRIWGSKSLSGGTFANMSKLEDLGLYRIELKEIPENTFNALNELKTLNLAANNITKLPKGLFKNLRNLEWIILYNNDIEELPMELFANNLMLESIDLDGNKLKTIETDFTVLPKMQTIFLSGNVCIDATFGQRFYREPSDTYSVYKTVQELQEIINTQCKQKQS